MIKIHVIGQQSNALKVEGLLESVKNLPEELRTNFD